MADKGAVAGGIIFLIVILIMGLFVWGVMKGHDDANEAFSKGCTATTASWTGVPSSFSCPVGTELSWDK